MTATRPIARYHGGKWRLAPWIISHFPEHRVYVEPFGGAGSVLLRKPRSYAEVYNDLDGEMVNLFRVVRDRGDELRRLLHLTPFSRVEYQNSFEATNDSMEQARRTVVRSYMGFGSNALNREVKTGFRSDSNRSGTTPAMDWQNYPEALPALVERLRGVVVENRDALDLIRAFDGKQVLFYVDPPYVTATRSSYSATKGYAHEMTDADHERLSDVLHAVSGMVVLSGYASPLYENLYRDWRRFEKATQADGARARTEVLWLSPNISVKETEFTFIS